MVSPMDSERASAPAVLPMIGNRDPADGAAVAPRAAAARPPRGAVVRARCCGGVATRRRWHRADDSGARRSPPSSLRRSLRTLRYGRRGPSYEIGLPASWSRLSLAAARRPPARAPGPDSESRQCELVTVASRSGQKTRAVVPGPDSESGPDCHSESGQA